MSLINAHSLDPALLYDAHELTRACERYQVDTQRGENEEDDAYHARQLKVRYVGETSTVHRSAGLTAPVLSVFTRGDLIISLCFCPSQKLMEVPLGEKVPRNK